MLGVAKMRMLSRVNLVGHCTRVYFFAVNSSETIYPHPYLLTEGCIRDKSAESVDPFTGVY